VPRVKDTVRRYLESVEPLLDEIEFARMSRLASEFVANEGPKLQLVLWLKSWSV
jgi:hypothetical protein